MASQFSIDDAFVLEGEEEGVGPEGDLEGWKGKDKERDGEMTFGPLSFTKPQTHPANAAGSPEHSNLKYQVGLSGIIAHHWQGAVLKILQKKGCKVKFTISVKYENNTTITQWSVRQCNGADGFKHMIQLVFFPIILCI